MCHGLEMSWMYSSLTIETRVKQIDKVAQGLQKNKGSEQKAL